MNPYKSTATEAEELEPKRSKGGPGMTTTQWMLGATLGALVIAAGGSSVATLLVWFLFAGLIYLIKR